MSRNYLSSREEFVRLLQEREGWVDCSEINFQFGDFRNLDLSRCRFWGTDAPDDVIVSQDFLCVQNALVAEAKPVSPSSVVSHSSLSSSDLASDHDDEDEALYAQARARVQEKVWHAQFMVCADFSGAILPSLKAFYSPREMHEKAFLDVVKTMFPEGYCNASTALSQLSLEDCEKSIRDSGGLTEFQLCVALQHVAITAETKLHFLDAVDLPETNSVKFFTYAYYQTKQTAVINISRIFCREQQSPQGDVVVAERAVSARHLKSFFNTLSAKIDVSQKIRVIQFPMEIDFSGSKHYVHICLLADDEKAQAVVFDSKDTIAATDLVRNGVLSTVRALVTEIDFHKFFGVAFQGDPLILYTQTQGWFQKNCGVYVFAGMSAVTKYVLANAFSVLSLQALQSLVLEAHNRVNDVQYLACYGGSGFLRTLTSAQCFLMREMAIEEAQVEALISAVLTAATRYADRPRAVVSEMPSVMMGLFRGARRVIRGVMGSDDRQAFDLEGARERLGYERTFAVAKQIVCEVLSAGFCVDTERLVVVNEQMSFLLQEMRSRQLICDDIDLSVKKCGSSQGLEGFELRELFSGNAVLHTSF